MDIYIVIIRRHSLLHGELIDEILIGTYSSMSYAKKIISDELAKIISGGEGLCGLADDVKIYPSLGKNIVKYAEVFYSNKIGIPDGCIDVYYIKHYKLDDEPVFD